jgi:hypothetical protein
MSTALAELGERPRDRWVGGSSPDRRGEVREELVVAPELGEVGEREVDGVGDGSGTAQCLQLGPLAIAT